MKKIVYFHIFNVFGFSNVGNYEAAFEKSRETFGDNVVNLGMILIISPLWIYFDFNSLIREYIGTGRYEVKHFFIVVITIIVILSYTRLNPLPKYIDKFYTTDLVDKCVGMYRNVPRLITYPYRLFFVLFNFAWVIIMFFVELKIFQELKAFF